MTNNSFIRCEEVIFSSDLKEFKLTFKEMPKSVFVQLYDKVGNLKSHCFKDNVISPITKTALLKKGDILKYIAVFD